MANDTFDRMLGMLEGLPDVLRTKPTTLRAVTPLVGNAQTFIVQTVRKRDEHEQHTFLAFLEVATAEGLIRMILPHNVLDALLNQREALQRRGRRKVAREQAAARKAAGIQPAFLRKP
jgi:hypothetical protein